jgi:hypothetical protein
MNGILGEILFKSVNSLSIINLLIVIYRFVTKQQAKYRTGINANHYTELEIRRLSF